MAPQIVGIVIGSTFKGLIVGVLAGWFARKVDSAPAGILFGLAPGAFLAYLVAAMPQPSGAHYYWEIIPAGQRARGHRRVCHPALRRRAAQSMRGFPRSLAAAGQFVS